MEKYMGRLVVLERLKKYSNNSFKIEWFGNIVSLRMPNGNVRCVRTVCRELPVSGQTSLLPDTVIVNLPLAFLSQVRLGDVWREGCWVGEPDLQEETFSSLQIDRQTMTTIEAGARRAKEDAGYALPFEQFDGHRDHIQSLLTMITIDEGRSLLIPCMEVLRFYFGSSGALLNKLFDGLQGLQEVIALAHEHQSGACELHLAKGMNSIAAPDIARIALDSHAQHAVKMLTLSGMRAAANCEAYHPRTLLPFNGETDLTVRGKWLHHGDQRTFLVLQIVRCTHPFPFNELVYHVWINDKAVSQMLLPKRPDAHINLLPPSAQAQTVSTPSAPMRRQFAFPDLAGKKMKAIWHRV